MKTIKAWPSAAAGFIDKREKLMSSVKCCMSKLMKVQSREKNYFQFK